MRLKVRVGDTTLLSTLASKGYEGVSEGFDYRREKVLGFIRKIPGATWYMIAKIDMSEIRQEINRHLFLVRLLVIFVVSAFGAMTGSGIWRQRMVFYRNRYEGEVQKMALRKHFDHVLKYANDIILLLDKELNIVEINDHALDVYYYSRDEIIGMHLSNLRMPENIYLLEDQIKILHEKGHTIFETIHRRKDGTTFPIEISARYFEIDGIEYYQSIGRDITERKKLKRTLMNYSKDLIWPLMLPVLQSGSGMWLKMFLYGMTGFMNCMELNVVACLLNMNHGLIFFILKTLKGQTG